MNTFCKWGDFLQGKNKHIKKKITQGENMGFSPQLTVTGNREAVLEGCREIKEYDETRLKFSLGNINICFCGNDLTVKKYGEDSAVICGEISDISFD